VRLVLGPIWRNRFGRNLRIKPNFVNFKFVILALHGFKILKNPRSVPMILR
jgi:hypothetical protein